METFEDMPKVGSDPVSGSEEPCLAKRPANSFPLIPMCSGTHTSCTLLHSANFAGGLMAVLDQCGIMGKLSWALLAA